MRKIKREHCVCKKCGFGYANITNHLCYTVNPPIYIARYHCPVCKSDGEVKDSEVFIREEELTDDGFTSDFEFAEPCPMPMQNSDDCNDPMPQKLVDDNGKEITLNGDTSNGETVSFTVEGVNNELYILNKESEERVIKAVEEIIASSNNKTLEWHNLIKCIKLMLFCGVNDLGALKDGEITQEEYVFMQQIFSKIEGNK